MPSSMKFLIGAFLFSAAPVTAVELKGVSSDGSACTCSPTHSNPYWSLLQQGAGRRPRDCTCVNGMKTYATTPRDELQDMEPAELVRHLKKCERERTHLGKTRDYHLAESETQEKDMEELVAQRQMMLDTLKNRTSKARAEDKSRHQDLLKETEDLEKERAELKTEYNKEFTKFYTMTQEMAGKLDRLSNCPAAVSKNETVFVSQRHPPAAAQRPKAKRMTLVLARQMTRLSPEDKMYDRIDKVGKCEDDNIDLNDEIEAAQAQTRKKTVDATEKVKRLSSAMVAQTKLDKIMSKTKQVAAAKKTSNTLEDAVDKLKTQLEDYQVKNAQLHLDLGDLDAELVSFGC